MAHECKKRTFITPFPAAKLVWQCLWCQEGQVVVLCLTQGRAYITVSYSGQRGLDFITCNMGTICDSKVPWHMGVTEAIY
jgi:hypothetical protein